MSLPETTPQQFIDLFSALYAVMGLLIAMAAVSIGVNRWIYGISCMTVAWLIAIANRRELLTPDN